MSKRGFHMGDRRDVVVGDGVWWDDEVRETKGSEVPRCIEEKMVCGPDAGRDDMIPKMCKTQSRSRWTVNCT